MVRKNRGIYRFYVDRRSRLLWSSARNSVAVVRDTCVASASFCALPLLFPPLTTWDGKQLDGKRACFLDVTADDATAVLVPGKTLKCSCYNRYQGEKSAMDHGIYHGKHDHDCCSYVESAAVLVRSYTRRASAAADSKTWSGADSCRYVFEKKKKKKIRGIYMACILTYIVILPYLGNMVCFVISCLTIGNMLCFVIS